MINPAGVQLPQVNRAFLRGIFWLIVFLFLASIFASARGIYDLFIRKPEVRTQAFQIGDDIVLGSQIWAQRAIVVHNRGNEDAKNVRVICTMPYGEITRLKVISEEDYSSSTSTTPEVCSFALPRLAAGAKLVLLVWTRISTANLTNVQQPILPIVSATFDGGTAEAGDKATALEEVRGIGYSLRTGTDVIRRELHKKALSFSTQWLNPNRLSTYGIHYINVAVINWTDFRSAMTTVFLLVATAWVLLPRVWAGFSIAILFGIVVWLFIEFSTDTLWLILPAILGLVALFNTKSPREAIMLWSFLILIGLILPFNTTAVDWKCLGTYGLVLPDMFSCAPSQINGGITFGFTLFALYLLIVEL